jgi:transcriptional regulator with XRE-family HTH domain
MKKTRAQLKVRMLRGISGLTQEELERAAGVEHIGHMEHGQRDPDAGQMARICSSLNLLPEDCEEMFRVYETRSAAYVARAGLPVPEAPVVRDRTVAMIEAILEEWEARMADRPDRAAACAADRERARRAWRELSGLETVEDMALVARVGLDYQTWAMVALLCDESLVSGIAARPHGETAGLAVEIARLVKGSDGWRRRLLGFATLHLAKARHAAGETDAARRMVPEARSLWDAGLDPETRLDPRRFARLEAELAAG